MATGRRIIVPHTPEIFFWSSVGNDLTSAQLLSKRTLCGLLALYFINVELGEIAGMKC
jgi:hypothetical protein